MNLVFTCIVLERDFCILQVNTMKQIAQVDFEDLDFDNLSTQDLYDIRAVIAQHYKHVSSKPGNMQTLKILTNLENYLKIAITPTRSTDQQVAYLLLRLPIGSQRASISSDTVLVSLLKQAFRDINVNRETFADVTGCVGKRRGHIDFMHDWAISSGMFVNAVKRENINQAYSLLKELAELSAQIPKKTSLEDIQFILCTQILNYLNIILALDRDLAYYKEMDIDYFELKKLNEFRWVVHGALRSEINNLIHLPDKQPVESNIVALRGMFFSCLRYDSKNTKLIKQKIDVDALRKDFYDKYRLQRAANNYTYY